MNKRRKFIPQFKSQVVLQVLSIERSMEELCHEYQLTWQMFGTWKQQFPAVATQAFESTATSHAEQERIAELGRGWQADNGARDCKKAAILLDGIRGRNGSWL